MPESVDPLRTRGDPRAWVDTVTYLAHAVAVVRDRHYVAAASTQEPPTWRTALERLVRERAVSAADLRRAREIRGWAASLKPRTPDSYRSRLAACLRRDRLTTTDLPLAASAVRAFNLHLYYEIRGRRNSIRRQPDPHRDAGSGETQRPHRPERPAPQVKPGHRRNGP